MSDTDETLLRVQVIAAALFASVVGFAVVIWLLTSGVLLDPQPLGDVPAPIPGVLVMVGALLLVAAPLVERRLVATPAAPSATDPAEAGDSAAEAAQRYQLAKTVSFALRESAALLGLLVTLVTGEGVWGYALCAAALVTMIIAWPRAGDLASRPADLDASGGGPVEPR